MNPGLSETVFVILVQVLIAAIVGGGIVFLLKSLPGTRRWLWEARAETAREILDQRYARGEITREQYEEMKRTLGT